MLFVFVQANSDNVERILLSQFFKAVEVTIAKKLLKFYRKVHFFTSEINEKLLSFFWWPASPKFLWCPSTFKTSPCIVCYQRLLCVIQSGNTGSWKALIYFKFVVVICHWHMRAKKLVPFGAHTSDSKLSNFFYVQWRFYFLYNIAIKCNDCLACVTAASLCCLHIFIDVKCFVDFNVNLSTN